MSNESTERTRTMPPSLNEMEGPIRDIARVGNILRLAANAENEIEGESMAWIGMQLVGMGRDLERLFYATHRECGGSGRGEDRS